MGQKLLFLAALALTFRQCVSSPFPIELDLRSESSSRLSNIHVSYARHVSGQVTFTYGPCHTRSWDDGHVVLARSDSATLDSRLVWHIPEDAPGIVCISAWDETRTLVGRSEPRDVQFAKRQVDRKRSLDPIHLTDENGFDTLGAWFDGIEALLQKEPSLIDVTAAKQKDIAIVGAGMSGLMTYLVLHQAGFTNLTLLEANNRVGGRVYTAYLSGGPFDYSYQEMGPMRFPVGYTDPDSGETYNISDTELVFSLINEINEINENKPDLKVSLIRWYDKSQNGLQYFNEVRMDTGLPPTLKQMRNDSSLDQSLPMDKTTKSLNDVLLDDLPGDGFMVEMAKNMYKAHKKWTSEGLGGKLQGDRWSEFAYISQYLKGSLNSTDVIVGPENADGSFWLYEYDTLYESADSWRTIDGGMSRLPEAFLPLVKDNLRLNTKIERVRHANNKVTLQWRRDYKDSLHSSTYDYAIVAVPFTVVRQWRMPNMNMVISNAIYNLVYDTCCKVALEYSERFWEKYENPIYGSCSTATDIPGINIVCYPSYNINGTGPATIIGEYLEGAANHESARMITMSEEEHVQYVLDAMTEIHGEETRKLYTGKFARTCWALDPFTAGSWASPSVGQHELYIPEYFKVHKNMIFVGEHTSYTHGWISSALDSGVRGAVQMLLELGLVDEAKDAVKKWIVDRVS